MQLTDVDDPTRQNQGPPGKRGPQGLRGRIGDKGEKGEMGDQGPAGEKGTSCDINAFSALQFKVEKLENINNSRPRSCNDIKAADANSKTGVYQIYSKYGVPYEVFCEMEGNGGGWTLVASIHENDMTGRCTTGDRWSSETGLRNRKKDSNWENGNTFGYVDYATSDDYKNKGYFELDAKQLMVIQVPNDTPLDEYVSSATYQYITSDPILQQNGGNLKTLFETYPLIDGQLNKFTDNGPYSPITFLKGDAVSAHAQYGPSMQDETERGFVQFRAVNHERGAFPLCPYGKIKPNKANVEHACFGGTQTYAGYCGDFSAFDYAASGGGWFANVASRRSAYLLLYR